MSATKTQNHDAIEAGMRSAPRELPILFSTPMVQAILDGRKTQTRRIVNTKRKGWDAQEHELSITKNLTREFVEGSIAKESQVKELVGFHAFFKEQDSHMGTKCPYGQPGDLLWVRESWFYTNDTEEQIGYKADFNQEAIAELRGNLKPSIHMPKAAARIWLQVEEIGVERLYDISEEDMLAEGIRVPVNAANSHILLKLGEKNSAINFLPKKESHEKHNQYQMLFAHWAELWCKINGRESWDQNPWLWVVKFKVLSTTGKPSFDSDQADKGISLEEAITRDIGPKGTPGRDAFDEQLNEQLKSN